MHPVSVNGAESTLRKRAQPNLCIHIRHPHAGIFTVIVIIAAALLMKLSPLPEFRLGTAKKVIA